MTAKRYTADHEWILLEGGTATVGITEHAQKELGDVVFVELPEPGKAVTKGGAAAVVESVKAASDVLAPVTGTVTAVNTKLADDPALVNRSAEGDGWFMKLAITDASEFEGLMDKAAYDKLVAGK